MATAGWNWTQLSMARAGNFRDGKIKRFSAQEVHDRGAMWLWHSTYSRSIPAVIDGLGDEWAGRMKDWTYDDYRANWGEQPVVGAFSDDMRYNRGVSDETYGRLVQHPHRERIRFSEFLDLLIAHRSGAPAEHVAVQQSPSQSFAEFGLPALPPGMEELVQYTLQARNFWAAAWSFLAPS